MSRRLSGWWHSWRCPGNRRVTQEIRWGSLAQAPWVPEGNPGRLQVHGRPNWFWGGRCLTRCRYAHVHRQKGEEAQPIWWGFTSLSCRWPRISSKRNRAIPRLLQGTGSNLGLWPPPPLIFSDSSNILNFEQPLSNFASPCPIELPADLRISRGDEHADSFQLYEWAVHQWEFFMQLHFQEVDLDNLLLHLLFHYYFTRATLYLIWVQA